MGVELDSLEIRVESAAKDAVSELDKLEDSLSRIRALTKSDFGLGNVSKEISKIKTSSSGLSNLTKGIGGLLAQTFSIRKIAQSIAGWVKNTNEYVENVNLFQVSMGDFYEEAAAYAELVERKLGIDSSEWMRNQGVFMSMATGFGLANDRAYELSESLTELAYDLSSLYNEDVESATQRLQSALAGEIEPIRRLGISISQATLQEYALSHGVTEAVSAMTEQEKAFLRSIKLMEDSQRIGAVGDFVKTLESPANAIRVLQQQIQQLSRALGSVFLPIITQAIPYVQAFVSIITDAIRALATLVGFEIPEWNNSDWDNTEDSINNVTGAVNDLKKATLGIDELNVISPNQGAGGAGSGSSWMDDFRIPDLWDKNAIAELESKTEEIKKKLKEILPLVAEIAAGFAAWIVAGVLLDGLKRVQTILGAISSISFASIGLALFLADWKEFAKYFEDFQQNGASFENVAGMISEFAGMVGDALIVLGNVKLGGALKVVQGIGEIVIAIRDMSQENINIDNVLTLIRGLSNLAIGIGLLSGNIKLAGAAIAVQGLTTIITELKDNWEAIRNGDWSGVDKIALIIAGVELLGGLLTAVGVLSQIKDKIGSNKAKEAIETVTTDVIAPLDGSTGTLSTKLVSLAKNLGLGVAVIAEVTAAAAIIVGGISLLGYELGLVAEAWQPVLNNGAIVLTGLGLGTTILVGIGVAAYGLGTLGKTAAINIGIGTLILAEIGIAAGLFVAEVWLVGEGLQKVGEAWQPVLNNGDTIATGIGLGTALLVGIGVVTAALGTATIAGAGLLPLAIGIGTVVLAELSVALVLFIVEISAVAAAINDKLAPVLEDLNPKLPTVKENLSDFTMYMSEFAEEVSDYSSAMGSLTWSNVKTGIQSWFADDPIGSLVEDVSQTYDDVIILNEKLEDANPELEKAIELMNDYSALMSELDLISNGASEVDLKATMFTNMKEVGKNLVLGISTGIKENVTLIHNEIEKITTSIAAQFSRMATQSVSAISSISAALNAIPRSIETVHTITTKEVGENAQSGVKAYASGGYPTTGELFIAREAGPELVGSYGSRTAVANNDQIVTGIQHGVEEANMGVVAALYQAISVLERIEQKDTVVEINGEEMSSPARRKPVGYSLGLTTY